MDKKFNLIDAIKTQIDIFLAVNFKPVSLNKETDHEKIDKIIELCLCEAEIFILENLKGVSRQHFIFRLKKINNSRYFNLLLTEYIDLIPFGRIRINARIQAYLFNLLINYGITRIA